MVKSERDADAKVPTKMINTDINAMIVPMASNIPPSPVNIIVNGIYIIDSQANSEALVTQAIEESTKGWHDLNNSLALNPWHAFVSPKRLITYFYPLLLFHFTILFYMNDILKASLTICE
jgi:hypothetical protein